MRNQKVGHRPTIFPQQLGGFPREIRGSKVSPNLVHLNACLDACSKASAWKEALAIFAHREVLSTVVFSRGYGFGG